MSVFSPILSFIICLVALPAVTSTFADKEQLEPLIVIERRMPELFSDASPWVSRISREDLEQRQIYNLADALRSVPGMAVVRTGQAGSQTSLFSRGAQSDHVTFLFEGRKLNGGFSGTYNLGQLALNGVSSLEVLRGSSSVQYGAEGIGGAVMLRSESKENRLNWTMEGGSNHSIYNGIDYGFSDSGWEGSVGKSLHATDNEQPHSQFDNQSVSFHLSRRVTENLKIDFLGLGASSEVNYPGNRKSPSYPVDGQYQEIEGYLVSPGITLDMGGWKTSAFYSYSEDNLIGKDSFSNTAYDAKTNSVELQLSGAATEVIQVTAGAEYQRDSFFKKDNATNAVDINQGADSQSVFVLSTFSLPENTSLTLGARTDNFSDYGSATTGSALFEKDLSEGLCLVTRYSTSFSPPQANDLYGMWGNPDLNPEKADSWEVGFVAKPNEILHLRFSYFETEFEDLIEWSGFTTSNVGSASSKGFESSLEAIQGNFAYRLSFSYLEAENSITNERLLRRPRFLGHLVVQHANENHTLGMGMKLTQDVMDIDGGTFDRVKGDDFAVIRVFGDYQITEEIKLFGRIENLLDKEYEEADGYPALGRAIFAGLGFSF